MTQQELKEKRKEMAAAAAARENMNAIALRYGVCESTVRNAIREFGRVAQVKGDRNGQA